MYRLSLQRSLAVRLNLILTGDCLNMRDVVEHRRRGLPVFKMLATRQHARAVRTANDGDGVVIAGLGKQALWWLVVVQQGIASSPAENRARRQRQPLRRVQY